MPFVQASQQDAETLHSQLGDASQERDSLRVQLRQKTEQLLSKEQQLYHMEREGELLRKQMAEEQSAAREQLQRLAQEHAKVGGCRREGRGRWCSSAVRRGRGLWEAGTQGHTDTGCLGCGVYHACPATCHATHSFAGVL